jgi:hypothetical protein
MIPLSCPLLISKRLDLTSFYRAAVTIPGRVDDFFLTCSNVLLTETRSIRVPSPECHRPVLRSARLNSSTTSHLLRRRSGELFDGAFGRALEVTGHTFSASCFFPVPPFGVPISRVVPLSMSLFPKVMRRCLPDFASLPA